jgi:hypothetical protein
MGIGGAVFLVAVGAIIAFGLHVTVFWLDLKVVGWVLMLSGLSVLVLTLWFWHDRRRHAATSVVEETRLNHQHGPVPPEPPEAGLPNPPSVP